MKSDNVTPQPTTCSGSGSNITFANTGFSTSSGPVTVLEDNAWRAADGIFMQNDGGMTINRCQSYNHENAVHLYGSSTSGSGRTQLGLIEACSVGTADPLPDDSSCGFLADGDHNGYDASDYTVVGGIWGQHLSNAFCINSDSPDAMKVVGASVGPAAGRRWGSMFKILRGNVTASSPQAHGKGNIWVAAGATLDLSSAYLPMGQIYTQDATSVINGCGNVLQYEELIGALYTPRECIGVLNAGFMPVYDNSGVLQNGQKTIAGSATLPSGGTITINLSGQAAFSNTSYTCSLTDTSALHPTQLTKNSASQFTITGTATDTIDYRCAGN